MKGLLSEYNGGGYDKKEAKIYILKTVYDNFRDSAEIALVAQKISVNKRAQGRNCAFFAPFFAPAAQKYLHKREPGGLDDKV